MNSFWKRHRLAHDLRADRPEPRPEFLAAVAEHVDGRPARGTVRLRVAAVAGLTALMLIALASMGGISYAASTANHTWHLTKRVVAPTHKSKFYAPAGKSSPASDQYAQQKVTLCHNGHTITVAKPAVPAHLAQGDTLGPCHTGVAGAAVSFKRGAAGGNSGLFAATTTANLPFTGFPLWAAALAGLVLVSGGLGLRRVVRQYQV